MRLSGQHVVTDLQEQQCVTGIGIADRAFVVPWAGSGPRDPSRSRASSAAPFVSAKASWQSMLVWEMKEAISRGFGAADVSVKLFL